MHGSSAVILFIVSITAIIVLTVKFRVNAAVAMLGVSLVAGIFCGIPVSDIANTMRNGFGSTIGYAGLVILEGMVIAVILENTGALASIAGALGGKISGSKPELAMAVTGYAVSVPVPCDSAYVLLSPLPRMIAESGGRSLAAISVAFSAGLLTTHCLVPPTPGPVSAMGILNASPVTVTLLGLAVALPGMLAGYFWAVKYVGKHEFIPQFDEPGVKRASAPAELPGVAVSLFPLLLPLLLMLIRAVAVIPSRPMGNSTPVKVMVFAGDPAVSLFVGVVCAFFLVRRDSLREAVSSWMAVGVRRAAYIIILAGAGGAFAAVIKASMITSAIVTLMHGWQIGILLPFIIAASLKTATGSSTISIITAASVVAPITVSLGINSSLAVLAVGSGAMMVSHVNDPYFWIVSKMSGMDEKTAFRFFTPATALSGVASFAAVAVLSVFIK